MDSLQRSPITFRPSIDDDRDVAWMASKTEGKSEVHHAETFVTNVQSPSWQPNPTIIANHSESKDQSRHSPDKSYHPSPLPTAWGSQPPREIPSPPAIPSAPIWDGPAFGNMAKVIADAIAKALSVKPVEKEPIRPGVRTVPSPFM